MLWSFGSIYYYLETALQNFSESAAWCSQSMLQDDSWDNRAGILMATVTEDSQETWQGGGNTEPYLAPELIKPTIKA